jgi:tripartite ATP-independent transporter DctM subunit
MCAIGWIDCVGRHHCASNPPLARFHSIRRCSQVSITQLFLAGLFPGLLMAFSLVIAWAIVARHDKVKTFPRQPWTMRLKAFLDGFFALLMPAIILGCIKFGWATPTEAAVFAAVYALFVGMFIYRELKFSQLYEVFLISAKTTAAVMFLVAAALISAWLITQANIPAEMGALLEGLQDNPTILLMMMMLLVIVVGTALDFTPTVLILTPILMPLVKQAGINEVYFGVLFIMNNAIGLITPPVGIVLNVVSGVARVPMNDVIKAVTPFLIAQTIVLFLLILMPQWVLAP